MLGKYIRPLLVFVLLLNLLTYLCSSLPVEHRPSTTPSHRTLFRAALVIPDQLVPCCFSSASVSRLQLLRGRPLFLFPCGFQVRAWRVVLDAGFLRVSPIQSYLCPCWESIQGLYLLSCCCLRSHVMLRLFYSESFVCCALNNFLCHLMPF